MSLPVHYIHRRHKSAIRLESWYTNWGLGYAGIEYPAALDAVLDLVRSAGADNVSLTLDILGFYWPTNEQTIVGFTVHGFGDRYSAGGDDFQINAYTFSASLMHFVNARIGDGLFIRADLGPSRLTFDGDGVSSFESDWGFGGLIGGGYGFPVSRETRILIHVNFAVRRVEGENFNNLGIMLSGLF